MRGAARGQDGVQVATKTVKDAVKATYTKYSGGAAKPARAANPADAAPVGGVVDAKIKAAIDRAIANRDEDVVEDAIEDAVEKALKTGDDATLKYALGKALDYDRNTGDDDAGGAVEDAVEKALRALGKRLNDRTEDAVENAIERAYKQALRNGNANAATNELLNAVKATFEKYNGGPVAKRAAAAPAAQATDAIAKALATGDEDAIEDAIEDAVADALQKGDDRALEYAVGQAIQYDSKRWDDDGANAVEDGVERALRALGKAVNDRTEDAIEYAVERAVRRGVNAAEAAGTVKATFEKFNGGAVAEPTATPAVETPVATPADEEPIDSIDDAIATGNDDLVEDAIKAVAVHSANDVARVLAENLKGGKEGNFADLMTRVANEIGLQHTNFENSSGLPNDDHMSTARDIALLSMAVYKHFPQYWKYFGIKSWTYGGKTYTNGNRLLTSFPGCDGMKTGFTNKSRYSLVATAARDDHHLIAVVLGAENKDVRANVATKMLNLGFSKLGISNTNYSVPQQTYSMPANNTNPIAKYATDKKPEQKVNTVVSYGGVGVQCGAFSSYQSAKNQAN
ncbi:MAG: D-alanyl-D-alanine carboxypeptidase, partial [Thermoguttaceae bacterium]|nr:D-alanyl-D-alanine carboxypeptidase [Thermoguttaceae bacterium]